MLTHQKNSYLIHSCFSFLKIARWSTLQEYTKLITITTPQSSSSNSGTPYTKLSFSLFGSTVKMASSLTLGPTVTGGGNWPNWPMLFISARLVVSMIGLLFGSKTDVTGLSMNCLLGDSLSFRSKGTSLSLDVSNLLGLLPFRPAGWNSFKILLFLLLISIRTGIKHIYI